MTVPLVETPGGPPVATVVHDPNPPGDRYYRHPDDAVRLVLWAPATLVLVALIGLATATTEGLSTDVGRVAEWAPAALRELALALVQVVALAVPVAVVAGLVARRLWRRLGTVVVGAAAGAGFLALLDAALSLHGRLPGAVSTGTWVASTRFPSLISVAALTAAATVGKPWLARSWRRAADIALVVLVVVMTLAGSAGLPALALALAAGCAAGAALLLTFGAPNRRPSPAAVALALQDAGLDVASLSLQRADGGRAQLYGAELLGGRRLFVKVYSHDSRDADLLYRGYRGLLLRGANDGWLSPSLKHEVEHEGFLLVLAREGGVACPGMELLSPLADGSMALVLEHVAGRPLDSLDAARIDPSCSRRRGGRWTRSTAAASPTGPSGRPTCWWRTAARC